MKFTFYYRKRFERGPYYENASKIIDEPEARAVITGMVYETAHSGTIDGQGMLFLEQLTGKDLTNFAGSWRRRLVALINTDSILAAGLGTEIDMLEQQAAETEIRRAALIERANSMARM